MSPKNPRPQEATRWGGPFDGRVDKLGSCAVYEAPRSGVASLGIPFRGGKTLGFYVAEPGGARLMWREAR